MNHSPAPKEKPFWQDIPLYGGIGLLIGVVGAYLGGNAFGFTPSTPVMGALGGLSVVLLGLHLFLSLSRHAFVGGAENLALSSIFVAIMVMLYLFVDRNPKRWDFVNTWYDLSGQTTTVFKSLKEPVDLILVFPEESGAKPMVFKLLKRLKELNPQKIKVLSRDPNDPRLAKDFNLNSPDANGQVLVKMGQKTKSVGFTELFQMGNGQGGSNQQKFDGEAGILKAVLGLQGQMESRICFLTQHGQFSLVGPAARLKMAKDVLEKDLYKVEEINLIREGSVPKRCQALVEVGSKSDLSDVETTAVLDYMAQGGRLWLNFNDSPVKFPNFGRILKAIGVKPIPGILINEGVIDANTGSPQPLVFAQPMAHPATQVLADYNMTPQFFMSYAFEAEKNLVPGAKLTTVLRTDSRVFADVAMALEKPLFTAGEDRKGPFEIGFAAMRPVKRKDRLNKDTRALVYGSALWMEDRYMPALPFNNELLLRGMAWLMDNDIKVKASPKPLGQATTSLTPAQHAMVNLLVFLVLPGFLIGMAISTSARNKAK